ncbi:MAG TPA: DoxX family protein [Vicinamibacterales bacterium]|nr:DoxX family protein [Vicinamibacterales bacterium]
MAREYIGSEWSPEEAQSEYDCAPRRAAETIPHVLGRAIFGGFFLYNGINHFVHERDVAGYAQAKGVPKPDLAVQLSGAMMIAGGLSLLTGYRPKIGSALITGFLAGVSPQMHAFWKEEDPQRRQGEMVNFMKNVALVGAAMIAAGSRQPWPAAVGQRRVAA